MSDLICPKTMRRCQTPGMCSPFGGCRDTDRDATVAGLRAQVELLTVERARLVENATALGSKCDQLEERCRELEECLGDEQRTRHQAELDGIALRAEVERLQGLLKEARYPVAHYLSDREEASDRAPTKSMRYEAGQSMLKVRRLLINIDAALEASR